MAREFAAMPVDDTQGAPPPPNPAQIAQQIGAFDNPSIPQTPMSQLQDSAGIRVNGNAPLPGTGGNTDMDMAAAQATLNAAMQQKTDAVQTAATQQRLKMIQDQADKIMGQLPQAEMEKAKADADAKAQEAKDIQAARAQFAKMKDELNKKENPPDVPPPEFRAQSPLEKFGSMSSMLGIFASMFTRTPVVNALNASASAMKAMDAGDVAAYNAAYDKWKDQSELAIKHANMDRERLKDIIELQSKDLPLAQAQAQAMAAERGWSAVALTNQANDLEGLAKLYESTGKAVSGYKNQMDFLKLQHERLEIDKLQNQKKEEENPSEDGLHDSAMTYAITGQMPSMGMGGTKYRQKVIDEAAKIRSASGISVEDVIAGRAGVKADTASLGKLTPQYDSITAFEETAKANMENALRLMDKGAGTEAGPVINRWLQAGRKATGDPDVAAFNSALYTATTEYAKVMSGAVNAQSLTDSARTEAEDKIISSIDSPEAVKKVYQEVMLPDMHNRKNSLEGQIKNIRGRISGFGDKLDQKELQQQPSVNTVTSKLPSAAAQSLKEGVHTTFGNGQTWTLKNGQPMQVQ